MVFAAPFDAVNDDYEPTVEVVVPMYNEGKLVRETVSSLLALDYPASNLTITFVDDASSDDSVTHVLDQARFAEIGCAYPNRKTWAMTGDRRAVRDSSAEIIVFGRFGCRG